MKDFSVCVCQNTENYSLASFIKNRCPGSLHIWPLFILVQYNVKSNNMSNDRHFVYDGRKEICLCAHLFFFNQIHISAYMKNSHYNIRINAEEIKHGRCVVGWIYVYSE